MKGSSRRRRSRSPRSGQEKTVPWGLLILCGLLYGFVGLFLASFPAPPWIWILALLGTLLQAIALAGPISLGRFRWLAANSLAALAILGVGLLVVALAIAMNYGGTLDLEQITPTNVALSVLKIGIVAIVAVALSSIMTAFLGDRLLLIFKRGAAMLVVAGTAVLGLGIGGLIGLVVVASHTP
ncbi:hypothetical protein [Almyronema epifaneia]|uniref:Uncharacterized protein n=1 Tax=Almyronema epifaneia S1 TaxID=2991925 RepID=A0ABW6ICN6_9CYAN